MKHFRPILAVSLCMLTSVLHAELKTGSSGILLEGIPLTMNGQTIRPLEAGQAVTVLGLKDDSKEAVVSVTLGSGEKVVGMLPQDKIIVVDSPTPTTAATTPAAPAPTPTPVPTLDLTKVLEAEEVAKFFKTDLPAAKKLCENKRIKIRGIIDRLDVENATSGVGDMPIIYLRTSSGLPRIKVKISNTVASNEAYYRKFNMPGWWWGYSNRSLDCRLTTTGEIQARAVYRGSGGYKSSTQWFTLFKMDEPIAVEAQCKGLYMDVTFDAGYMLVEK